MENEQTTELKTQGHRTNNKEMGKMFVKVGKLIVCVFVGQKDHHSLCFTTTVVTAETRALHKGPLVRCCNNSGSSF